MQKFKWISMNTNIVHEHYWQLSYSMCGPCPSMDPICGCFSSKQTQQGSVRDSTEMKTDGSWISVGLEVQLDFCAMQKSNWTCIKSDCCCFFVFRPAFTSTSFRFILVFFSSYLCISLLPTPWQRVSRVTHQILPFVLISVELLSILCCGVCRSINHDLNMNSTEM